MSALWRFRSNASDDKAHPVIVRPVITGITWFLSFLLGAGPLPGSAQSFGTRAAWSSVIRDALDLEITDFTPNAVAQALCAAGVKVTADVKYPDIRRIDTSGETGYRVAGLHDVSYAFAHGRLVSINIRRQEASQTTAVLGQRVRDLSAILPLQKRSETFAAFRGADMQVSVSLLSEFYQGLEVSSVGADMTQQNSSISCSGSPAFRVTRATSPDGRSIRVEYATGAMGSTQPVRFRVYRSSEPRLNGSESAIGEETVSIVGAPKADYTYDAVILQDRDLVPDTNRPYVVVVGEAGGQTSTAYFRKHMLGVIVHGYTFKLLLEFANRSTATQLPVRDWLSYNDEVEDWQFNMKTALELVHCYDSGTVAFDWGYESVTDLASLLTSKGMELFERVDRRATAMEAQHDGDVVDVHFIGHSRGTVLIGQALKEWAKRKSPALAGSYVRVTLLDPHPANNSVKPQEDVEPGDLGRSFYDTYYAFQDRVKDPAVVLPAGAGIRQVTVFFQQSRVSDIQSHPPDLMSRWSPLNLWGQGGSLDFITRNNASGVPIEWHQLTTFPTGEVVNHSGVVTYYERELWAHQSPLYEGRPGLGNCLAVPR
jgi:hypothetical protein